MNNSLASPKVMASHGSNRGPLEHMHVEPTGMGVNGGEQQNGVIVTQHFAPKSKSGSSPEPQRDLFTDHKKASKHIAAVLAAHCGAGMKGK